MLLRAGAQAAATALRAPTRNTSRVKRRCSASCRAAARPVHAGAALVLEGGPSAEDTVLAALAHVAQASTLQPAGIVPALRSALASLQDAQGQWERAVLASPLLQGLLSLCTDLLDTPAVVALGPEAPLLVLEVLSHLPSSDGSDSEGARQDAHCRALWFHAHVSLGSAADAAGIWGLAEGQDSLMTPDMITRYYEAAARSPFAGAPSKNCGMGHLLRAHLRCRRFSAEEAVRLLAAWAQLRRRMPFNPDPYNFAELASALSSSAASLTAAQLVVVAEAATVFEWPVYHSVPLLHAVSRAAMHRSLAGGLPLPVAQRVMASSAKGAAAMRPRLGRELEEASGEWVRTAPIVRNSSVPVPASLPLGPAASRQQQPQQAWVHGAAAAAMAEAGNSLAHVWLDATSSVDF